MRWIHTRPELFLEISGLLCLLFLFGCSSKLEPPIPAAHPDDPTPRRGGILTVATFGDLRSLDPAALNDGLGPLVLESILAGLVDFDRDGKMVTDLAESYRVEDEGKTIRFVLRRGVKFHDGEELTAEDVKRSTERSLSPSAPNPYSSYFSALEGYDAFHDGKTEHLEGVKIEGRYQVSYRLLRADSTFLPLLGMHLLRPVCKSAGWKYQDTWLPCGAGPFKLAPNGWDRGRQVDLVRHDGYFKPGQPYLDGVRFLFHVNQMSQRFRFMRGELDIYRDLTAPDLLALRADPRWSPFGEFETPKQIGGESMNCEIAPFDNVEVRRAVASALDRDAITMVRASNLTPCGGPIPSGMPGFDPTFVGQTYDYAAALEHMKKAGYPYDPVTKKGGWPKPIPYLVYKQGLYEFTAQVVAQQLAKIGIRIELRLVNYPTYLAVRGRRHEAAMGPGFWQNDYPDAMSFLEPLFSSKSINDGDSNDWSFWSNPRYDELIEQGRRELDPDRRKGIYREASEIVADQAPWAFTIQYRWFSQRQPYVRDWYPHPMWTHELSGTFVDRSGGPLAAGKFFSKDAFAALVGSHR